MTINCRELVPMFLQPDGRDLECLFIAPRDLHFQTRTTNCNMLLHRLPFRNINTVLHARQPSWMIASRSMTTAATKKKEFLCILPDQPNVLDIRKKVKG